MVLDDFLSLCLSFRGFLRLKLLEAPAVDHVTVIAPTLGSDFVKCLGSLKGGDDPIGFRTDLEQEIELSAAPHVANVRLHPTVSFIMFSL